MTDAEFFDTNGCVRVNNFIDPATISIVSRYLENKIVRGEWTESASKQDPTSRLAYYADPLIEVLLQECKTAVEEATGKTLIPTYSYARVYQPGEQLKPHVDRPACEISVTINVATKGSFSPIREMRLYIRGAKHCTGVTRWVRTNSTCSSCCTTWIKTGQIPITQKTNALDTV
jgi:hypothetical protein